MADSIRIPSRGHILLIRSRICAKQKEVKDREETYRMGIVKNSFFSVWYRVRASQASGPRGPFTKTSPN
jgi:hypothetical protein